MIRSALETKEAGKGGEDWVGGMVTLDRDFK